MRWLVSIVLAIVLVAGLWTPRAPQPNNGLVSKPPAPISLGNGLVPNNVGTLRGRVQWAGPLPEVGPIPLPENPYLPGAIRSRPNPNRPQIDANRGVASTLVYLEHVDQPRPWDHAPVTVQARSTDYVTMQGEREARIGIVRWGDQVRFTATEPDRHSMRARGASFFTAFLYDPTVPVERAFNEPGYVELSSGTGLFWCKAHLFVIAHPYATLTGEDGSWQLDRVPAGTYQVRVLALNWHIVSRERDPELSRIVRLNFARPFEQQTSATVVAGQTTTTEPALLKTADFEALAKQQLIVK